MNLDDLKKELPYKWRVQSASSWGAVCVAYIDARDVQGLLDEVCGPMNWQCKFYEVKGNLFCSIGVREGDTWTWKSDCGTESNVEKQKGEASDAFKRAAVSWGIGRFLYALDPVKLPVNKDDKSKFHPYSEKQKRFIKDSKGITDWCNAMNKQNNK